MWHCAYANANHPWTLRKAQVETGAIGTASPALVEGRYDLVPIPDAKLGPRKLDVDSTYNTERYRPIYANTRGLPIFLNRAT